MFDLDYSYHLNPSYKKSIISDYGEIFSYLYKVKTTKKKPYLIRVDEFKHDLFFIKFFPKKLHNHKDKYKKRVGKVNEFSRLVSTCIKLSKDISLKKPDASFGFHGQWDTTDIENEETVSQRYRIYKMAVMSKVNKENYKFVYVDSINSMIIIPVHVYNEQYKDKLFSLLDNLFGKELSKFRIPTKEEYKTYNI